MVPLQIEWEATRAEMEREAKRAAKVESRAALLTGGLQQRDEKLRKQAEEAWTALQLATTDLRCFQVWHWRSCRQGLFEELSSGSEVDLKVSPYVHWL